MVELKSVGDPHNGGRHVKLVLMDGLEALWKPRSVFWENLFFGDQSDLKRSFNLSFDAQVTGNFFQLSRLIQDTDSAIMAKIDPNLPSENLDSFLNFGTLLGYCFGLGIQDLHMENVIPTFAGLQPVDIETVFGLFDLPDQTFLVNRRNSACKKSALIHLDSNPNELAEPRFFSICIGFIKSLSWLAANSNNLVSTINLAINQQLVTPRVRVLLRPTSVYRQILEDGHSENNLLESENVQIAAGDIPFFFKYLNNKQIFFLDKSLKETVLDVPLSLRASLIDPAQDPALVLDCDRLMSKLLPQGLAYLVRHHLCSTWMGEYKSNLFNMTVGEGDFRIEINNQTYQAPRFSPFGGVGTITD